MESTHYNPDLLLAHADFVRALCGKLVFDDGTAQDVAQETWLSALEHPPRTDRPVRAWLSKVARNHVLQLRRAGQRRIAREQANARDAGVPSTAAIVERESARRSVVAAVVSLSEPYRSTILLRYYEDLPPREVARRLGVPVETVRTRLKRSHALLRARLDDDYGDDRAKWCQALLPLALARSGRMSLGNLALKLGLFIVGALMVAFTVWATRGGSSTVASAASNPPPPLDERVASASLAASGNRQAVGNAAISIGQGVEVAPHCTARGTTVDERGDPLGGVRVVAFSSMRPEIRDGEPLDPIAATSSDARGNFEIQLPNGSFFLSAAHGERVAVAGFAASLPAAEFNDIVLQLAPSIAAQGQVMDGNGSAVAGALVRATTLDRRGPGRSTGHAGASYRALIEHTTLSNADGSFVLRDLPAVKNFVSARRAGFESAGIACTATRTDIELVLEPIDEIDAAPSDIAESPTMSAEQRNARVRGRVVEGSSGKPIEHFTLTVRSPAVAARDQHQVFDSQDGTFELSGLAAATSIVAVRADGYAPWSSRPRDLSRDSPVFEIELAAQRDLDVRVIDARGEPVQHARLVCTSEHGRPLPTSVGDGYWNDTVILAPDGTARVCGLPAALVMIEVRVPELATCEPFTFDLRTPLIGRQELRLPCDLSSPRRAALLEFQDAKGPLRGEFHVDARDARGAVCASFVLVVSDEGAAFMRPLRYLVQRYDASGVMLANSLQTLDNDSLVRDHGPQLITTSDSPQVRVQVPLGDVTFSVVAQGYAPKSAALSSRDEPSHVVIELTREP